MLYLFFSLPYAGSIGHMGELILPNAGYMLRYSRVSWHMVYHSPKCQRTQFSILPFAVYQSSKCQLFEWPPSFSQCFPHTVHACLLEGDHATRVLRCWLVALGLEIPRGFLETLFKKQNWRLRVNSIEVVDKFPTWLTKCSSARATSSSWSTPTPARTILCGV